MKAVNERRRGRRVRVRAVAGLVAVAAVLFAGCGGASNSVDTSRAGGRSAVVYRGTGTVGYLAPAVTIKIWSGSWVPQFASYMKQVAPNVKVLPYYANFDVATQLSQAQAAIAQGARVLVVASVDPNQTAALAAYARSHGVQVIASNRQFLNAPVAGYVGDDAFTIGKAMGTWLKDNTTQGQSIATLWGDATDVVYSVAMKKGAMSVLEPLFRSGARVHAGDVFTRGYLPSNARSELAAILAKSNNRVDAVLTANDDMAGGAIAAVDAAGLNGKVKVIGGDATVDAIQRILRGTQAMTIYHSLDSQQIAAKTAAYLLSGKPVPADLYNTTAPNGKVDGKTIQVPFAFQPPMAVTKDNVDETVKTRFLTRELICRGMPAGIQFCG